MPCADCYFCVIKYSSVSSPIGIPNNPFGCCQVCNSFACGSHGDRLPAGEFKCIICEPLLAAKSSGVIAEDDVEQSPASVIINQDLKLKQRIIDKLLLSYNPKTDRIVRNLNEFIEHTSRFNREKLINFNERYSIKWNDETNYQRQLHRIIDSFPKSAEELLFAAILLVKDTESELLNLFPQILLDIADALRIYQNPNIK